MEKYRLKNKSLKIKESEETFKVSQFNCDGLSKKLSEVKLHLYTGKPDLLCSCETWKKKQEPRFVGYKALWKHRIGREKGGLAILVREDIRAKEIVLQQFNRGKLECQAIEINTHLGAVRILNGYNVDNLTVGELSFYIQQLGDRYIIVGDYNAHSPMWDRRNRSNPTGLTIEDTMNRFSLFNK